MRVCLSGVRLLKGKRRVQFSLLESGLQTFPYGMKHKTCRVVSFSFHNVRVCELGVRATVTQ